jgi:phage N-6-adenine-methyltransferase
MTFNKVHFSSLKMDWPTPDKIFKMLDETYHFDLDACASKENAKCANFISPEQGAFEIPWDGKAVFCNPPYGRKNGGILRWCKKAYEESQRGEGRVVVMFIPARTDTKYFHQYCLRASREGHGEIHFLDHRVSFGKDNKGKVNNAPFPSMVVVFRKQDVIAP